VTDGGDVTLVRLSQALEELSKVQMDLDAERVRRVDAESALEELVRSMSDALLQVDARGVVTRANEQAERLWGRPAAALEGVDAEAVLPAGVPVTPWALLGRFPAGRFSAEAVVAAHDGDRPVSLSGAVIRNRAGRITGGVYAARDLSETQRLVGELAAATGRWRILARTGELLASAVEPAEVLPAIAEVLREDTSCTAGFVLVHEGLVARAVVAGGEAAAAALVDLQGRPVPAGSALEAVVDGVAPAVHLPAVPPGYPVVGTPLRGVRAALVLPVPGAEGVHGALVVLDESGGAIDEGRVELLEQVADRVGAALGGAALRTSLARLAAEHEARQAREDMVAGVSHDMKTPLTLIRGFVDVLLEGKAGDLPPDDLLRLVRRQTVRLQRLVSQFLDFTRLEADRALWVQVRALDIRHVLRDTVATVDQSERVVLALPDKLPPVSGDPQRLDQVFANLLTNALKFSPVGEPVDVEAVAAGRTVRVTVADRGPGIDPADADRLFEKFARGRQASTTEGTGLGLYVTRQVVEAGGGHLHVEPRTGGGSRFVVSLPVAEGAS
jgi:PAS domain S-box-containing protein